MARHRKHRKPRPSIAIVGDGETEQIYFQNYKATERPAGVKISPELPRRKDGPLKSLKRAIELKVEGYSEVFALIDMDVILENTDIEKKYYALKSKAVQKNVVVLENNPCFEIWLLCHFLCSPKPSQTAKDIIKELGKSDRIPDYSKSKTGLYSNYKHLIQDSAIPNAQQLEQVRSQNGSAYPEAGVYRLMKRLLAF